MTDCTQFTSFQIVNTHTHTHSYKWIEWSKASHCSSGWKSSTIQLGYTFSIRLKNPATLSTMRWETPKPTLMDESQTVHSSIRSRWRSIALHCFILHKRDLLMHPRLRGNGTGPFEVGKRDFDYIINTRKNPPSVVKGFTNLDRSSLVLSVVTTDLRVSVVWREGNIWDIFFDLLVLKTFS